MLYLVIYVVLLGARPLVAPDETRYAEIPREMAESGDWIVPTLDGLVYFEKPPLGYWTTAASFLVFGQNRFATRLTYAISTGIAALVVFVIVRRSGGGRWPGLLAAVAFLTCAQVWGVGTFAVLDALQAVTIIAAMGTFWLGYVQEDRLKRHAWYAAFGACCGLAFLTKGFLAFIFPVVSIVPFMFWERRWRELFVIPWIPMAAAAVVALPWSLAVGAEFWDYFFWEAHFRRFTMGKYHTYPEPWWYYAPFILGGALPWIVFLPTAVKESWRIRPWDSFMRYNACWFILPVLFLSLSKGKLGPYIQPCFAPLAIWIVVWMTRAAADSRRTLNITAIVMAAIAALAAIGTLIQTTTDVLRLDRTYLPSEAWKGYVGTAALLACIPLLIGAWRARLGAYKYAFFAAALGVLYACAPFMVPAWLHDKTPEAWLELHAPQVPDDAILVADGHFVHAVCWQFKRDDVYVVPNFGEMRYALNREDGKHMALTPEELRAMILDPDRTRTIALWAMDDRMDLLFPDGRPEGGLFELGRGALMWIGP